MISENLVEIMGYLADDPVIRKTMDGKPVCNFTVGVNRSENVTDWIDCVTWEKSAEFMNAHAHKGSPVYVRGVLNTRTYQPRDYDRKIKSTIVNCSRVVLLESNREHVRRDDDYHKNLQPQNGIRNSYEKKADELGITGGDLPF